MDKFQESFIYKSCANVLTWQPFEAPGEWLQQGFATTNVWPPFKTPWTFLQHRLEMLKLLTLWQILLSLICRSMLALHCTVRFMDAFQLHNALESTLIIIRLTAMTFPTWAAISSVMCNLIFMSWITKIMSLLIQLENIFACFGVLDKTTCPPEKTIPISFHLNHIYGLAIQLMLTLIILYGLKCGNSSKGTGVGKVDVMKDRSSNADIQAVAMGKNSGADIQVTAAENDLSTFEEAAIHAEDHSFESIANHNHEW